MPQRVRVGVIGLGPNGRAHLANYQAHPGAPVVAVCDVNPELAAQVAAEPHIPAVHREIFCVEGDYIHDLRGYPHTEDPFGSDGVHPLDILRWYVGEPVEVQAYSNRLIWPELESPTTVAIYRFAAGCIGKVTVTWV